MTKDECFYDNCKLSKDPSGIANSAQRSTLNLLHIQSNRGIEIYAWVILSNHIHLVFRSSISDLSGTIRDFKKFTSK